MARNQKSSCARKPSGLRWRIAFALVGLTAVVVLLATLPHSLGAAPALSQSSPRSASTKETLLFNANDLAREASAPALRAEKDWVTYVDIVYGYLIRYPSGWVATELKPTPTDPIKRIVVFRPDVPDSYFSAISNEIDPDLVSIASVTILPGTIGDVLSETGRGHSRDEIQVLVIKWVRLTGDMLAWDYQRQASVSERYIAAVLPIGPNTLTLTMNTKPSMFADYQQDFARIFEIMLDSIVFQ